MLEAVAPRTRRGLFAAAVSTLVLTLAACQAPAPDEQEAVTAQAQQAAAEAATPTTDTAPQPPPIGSCDASQLQSLVGQKVTETLTEQARQDAHATSVRVLEPGQMVTMEFNGERLTLDVDAQHVVTAARCG
ncbi:MAG TPA: I78 family peptidase inhibitor [Stenotrophomonas sp.]|jgi:hypothetical protein